MRLEFASSFITAVRFQKVTDRRLSKCSEQTVDACRMTLTESLKVALFSNVLKVKSLCVEAKSRLILEGHQQHGIESKKGSLHATRCQPYDLFIAINLDGLSSGEFGKMGKVPNS